MVSIICLLSFPSKHVQSFRGYTTSFLSPLIKGLKQTKELAFSPLRSYTLHSLREKKIQELEKEKKVSQIAFIQAKQKIQELQEAPSLRSQEVLNWSQSIFEEEKEENYQKILSLWMTKTVPAEVVFRAPLSWGSSFWINKGSSNNKESSFEISENSPVVSGNNLIGLVDYVGKNHSRVRLITDSGLSPSVRVARGCQNQINKLYYLQELIDFFEKDSTFVPSLEKSQHLQSLRSLKNHLLKSSKSLSLAKGELRGSSQAVWSQSPCILKGTGFNYSFKDEEGPARELKSGKANNKEPIPLILEGDLLITTGLDGVFPKGLHVAKVTKVFPLKSGDYFYNIEATPTAKDIHNVSSVLIMPSLNIPSLQAF